MTLTLDTLESWLWDSADLIRGSMDSSDFKNYIFGLLFLKRANDVFFEEVKKAQDEGYSFDEAVDDKDLHRFFFLPKEAWWDTLTSKTEHIGEAIDKAFTKIEESNSELEGVMTAVHFGDKERLTDTLLQRLLSHFSKYSLSNENLENPDLLGSAYEYLIKMFADDAGKKGGEFYTPKGVVELIVKLIKPEAGNTVYDPTCGSGGMLITSARYIKEHGGVIRGHTNVSLKGQEKNLGTWAICKINMILHQFKNADIQKGDTLTHPKHAKDNGIEQFDRVIANPPFSMNKWWELIEVDIKKDAKGEEVSLNYAKEVTDPYGRFSYGIPPRGYADLAFVQHMIASLKPTGRMGVVLPHGVLFRGGSEGTIRKGILNDDLIEAVVGLPSKLFYNTGIPACILLINKSKSQNMKNKVIFIDGSNNFKDGKNQNSLEPEHVNKVITAFDALQDIDKFMRIVDISEIKDNDYNLNIARYIDTSDEEEQVNIPEVLETIAGIEEKEKDIDLRLSVYLKELGYVN